MGNSRPLTNIYKISSVVWQMFFLWLVTDMYKCLNLVYAKWRSNSYEAFLMGCLFASHIRLGVWRYYTCTKGKQQEFWLQNIGTTASETCGQLWMEDSTLVLAQHINPRHEKWWSGYHLHSLDHYSWPMSQDTDKLGYLKCLYTFTRFLYHQVEPCEYEKPSVESTQPALWKPWRHPSWHRDHRWRAWAKYNMNLFLASERVESSIKLHHIT